MAYVRSIYGNSSTASAMATYASVNIDALGRVVGGSPLTLLGDVAGTASNGTLTVTLTPTGVTPGTFNGIVINAKGQVIQATGLTFLTANQPVTLSGDVSGTGSTAIAVTLAAIGTAGTWGGTNVTLGLVTDRAGRVISAFTNPIVFPSSVSGNAATATALQNPQPIAIAGDAIGTASFAGSSGATITATLAASGVAAGTYGAATLAPTIAVDAKGRVTSLTANPIAFPVTMVNGQTGAVSITSVSGNAGTASALQTAQPIAP